MLGKLLKYDFKWVYTSEEFENESFSTKKRTEKAAERIRKIDDSLGLKNVLAEAARENGLEF